MSKRPASTLADIMSRAQGLFVSQTGLSIQQAVAQTLRRLEPKRLERIYRESGEAWCATALQQGGQMMITLGMEVLSQRIRLENPHLREYDEQRKGKPAESSHGSDRANLHRRRQAWRSRGGKPPRKNPPRNR